MRYRIAKTIAATAIGFVLRGTMPERLAIEVQRTPKAAVDSNEKAWAIRLGGL